MHPSRSSRRRARRAFSLIEILIAVTILGIMAAVFVPRLGFLIGSSKQKRAFSEMATLSNQITIYMTQNGMSSLGDDFELGGIALGTILVIVFFHMVKGRTGAGAGTVTRNMSHPDYDEGVDDAASGGTHKR